MQATSRKTRILDVVYNASNNELVSFCLLPECVLLSGCFASLFHMISISSTGQDTDSCQECHHPD